MMDTKDKQHSEAEQRELKQEEAIYQAFQQVGTMHKLGWLGTTEGEKLRESIGEGIGHVSVHSFDKNRSAYAEENVVSFMAGATWAIRGGRLG